MERAVKRYVGTFVALLALTSLTLGLSFLDLHGWGPEVAVAIGIAKAVLIALFFMHLVEQRTTNWVAMIVAVLLFGALFSFALLDVLTREGAEILPRLVPFPR